MKKMLLHFTKNSIYAAISIGTFLVLWAIGVSNSDIKIVMPLPWTVLGDFFDSFIHPIGRHTIIVHILYSLMRVVPAYIVGSFTGVVLGILMGWFRPVNAILRPIYELIRPIPPIAWIPISIVWFGIGESSKWYIIFLAAIIPVTLNSISGARSVDPLLIKCGQMLGASKKYIFKSIVLPFSVPYIFSGLQVGLAGSWATVVAAEMIRSNEGVGWIIISSMDTNDVAQGLVGIIAIGIVGFLLATLMRRVEDKLCAWTTRDV